MSQALPQRSLFAIVCCGAPPSQDGMRLGQIVGRAAHDARGAAIGRVDDVIMPADGSAATALLALDDGRTITVPLARLRLDAGRVTVATH